MKPTTNLYLAHAAVAGANIIYGLNFNIAKSVMPLYLGPQALSVLRIVGASALFWILSLWQTTEKVALRDMPRLFVASLLGVSINQNLFLMGLSLSSPIDASIIVTSNPVIVLLIMSLVARQAIPMRKLAGIALGIAGAMVVILRTGELGFNSGHTLGNVLVLVNSVSYSYYLIYIQRLTEKYSPFTVMRWLFTLGILPAVAVGWGEMQTAHWAQMDNSAWLAVSFVVIASTFLAYLLNAYGIKHVGPTLTSAYINAQPLVASLVAVAIGVGRPGAAQLTSALLMVAGIYLVSSRRYTLRTWFRGFWRAHCAQNGRIA